MSRPRRSAALRAALRRLEEVQGLPPGELTSALGDASGEALRAKVEISVAATREMARRAEYARRVDPGLPDHLEAVLQALADLFEAATAAPEAPLPAVTPAFPTGTALVPSSFPLQAAVAALHHAPQLERAWGRDERGFPVFAFRQRQGTAFVTLEPPPGDEAGDQGARVALWDQLKQLGDLDGDVLFAALAQWMRAREGADARGYAVITGQAILDYRGVRPRMQPNAPGGKRYARGHRVEDLEVVAGCWARLRLVYLDLHNVEYWERPEGRSGRRGRPRRSRYSLKAELIHVPHIVTQRQLDGRELAVAWRFRPGEWVARYLEAPNKQIALLLQSALTYDPYRERWEKRLARYCFIHLRISAKGGAGAPVRRNVGAVLYELGLADAFDRRNPDRTVRRFEAAMDRLRADGHIGAWRLTEDAQTWWDERPPRGWLDAWFGVDGRGGVAMMDVTPPPATAAQYEALPGRAAQAKQEAGAAAAARSGRKRPPDGGG